MVLGWQQWQILKANGSTVSICCPPLPTSADMLMADLKVWNFVNKIYEGECDWHYVNDSLAVLDVSDIGYTAVHVHIQKYMYRNNVAVEMLLSEQQWKHSEWHFADNISCICTVWYQIGSNPEQWRHQVLFYVRSRPNLRIGVAILYALYNVKRHSRQIWDFIFGSRHLYQHYIVLRQLLRCHCQFSEIPIREKNIETVSAVKK
jgi:hypothetical protein